MCNLYNVTTTRDAVMQFTKAFSDKAAWNEAWGHLKVCTLNRAKLDEA